MNVIIDIANGNGIIYHLMSIPTYSLSKTSNNPNVKTNKDSALINLIYHDLLSSKFCNS